MILYLLYSKQNAAHLAECAELGIPENECSLIDKIVSDFKSVNVLWIGLICIIFMLSNLLRAWRWNQLLDPLGYKPKIINSLGAIMLGYFTNLAVPRIGEVVRAASLAKYENIPAEKIFGTIVVDRILDVISLLIVIGIAFIFSFETVGNYIAEKSNISIQALIYFFIIASILGLVGLWILKKFIIDSESTQPFFLKIRKLILGFKDGLLSVLKVKNLPFLIFNSIGIWLMYYLMTYLCFFAFEPTSELGPVAGLVTFVFGSLGMVIPSPGGIGTYQWLVTEALLIYNVEYSDAFSFSNIMFFTIQIFCNIAIGVFFYLFLPFYNRKSDEKNLSTE
ncbi:MAG: flippase-like domain-containing protein [Saprospiraceae bacterium]|nr:flippase-like domain-containing protein [Saprospiraceae bacterium]